MTEAIGDLYEVMLPARLDAAAVRRLAAGLPGEPWSVVILNAARVTTIEPVGALLLFRLCRELEARGEGPRRGPRVRLENLSPRLARQLRSHPLRSLRADYETLFQDPDDRP